MTDRQTESNLDTLWQRVIEYRSSKHFEEILKACTRFRNLAPYNAMLVQMQRPGAEYVLTEEQWERLYGRTLKPNARPLIILVPFGPVQFVFEIGDTVRQTRQGTLFGLSDEEIIDRIAAPYRIKQNVPRQAYDNLVNNLVYYGISDDFEMVAGAGYAAKIEPLAGKRKEIHVPVSRPSVMTWNAGYLLSVNRNAERGEQFASVCHELGHLFCHHLPMPPNWNEKGWKVRKLHHKWEEFEAESVSWIVCERLGIHNPSEGYLAGYASQTDSVSYISQQVSIERILAAANEIERMLNPLKYRDGLLYRHCGEFKRRSGLFNSRMTKNS